MASYTSHRPWKICATVLIAAVLLVGAVTAAVWQAFRPSIDQRFNVGLAALLAGDVETAECELDQLPSDKAWLSHRRLLQGGILLRSGDPAGAERWLLAIDRNGELRRPALLLLGECLYRQQRLAESEVCFLHMVDDHPDDVDARRWLGSIYYDLGTVHAATKQLDYVVGLAPDDFRAHRFLGVIYQDLEKYAQAAEEYRTSLSLDPPVEIREEIHLDLARSLAKSHRYDEALDSLLQLNSLSDNVTANSIRAECLYAQGQTEVATSLVTEVLESMPNDRDALLLQARIAQDQQHWDQAIASLNTIVQMRPHDYAARFALARVYANSGDRERSQLEMKLGEHSQQLRLQAADLYEQADANPTNPEYRDALAAICDELGEPHLARMWRTAAESLRVRLKIHGGRETPGK